MFFHLGLIFVVVVVYFVSQFWLPVGVYFYILGRPALTPSLLGESLVRANVRHFLCLVPGTLYGDIIDPQLVTPSAGPGCIWKGPRYAPTPAFPNSRPRNILGKNS